MGVASIQRSLEHELFALLRGASLECLVCGEFVMHVGGAVVCPECRSVVAGKNAAEGVDAIFAQLEAQAG